MARRGWFIDGNVLAVARGGRFYGMKGGDTTSPVVVTATYDNGTGALTLNITEASGSATCYWAFVTNPSAPSVAQIKAGTDGGILEAGSFTVTSGGDTDTVTLTNTLGNELHLVIEDAAGNNTGTPSALNNTIITGVSLFVYEEYFTSDVSANWTLSGAGSKVYDATNDEIDFTPVTAWETLSSPAITVSSGRSYEFVFTLRNDDPATGAAPQADVIVGTTVSGTQIVNGSTTRVNEQQTVAVTQTFVATANTIYISARARGTWPGTSAMALISLTLQDVTP